MVTVANSIARLGAYGLALVVLGIGVALLTVGDTVALVFRYLSWGLGSLILVSGSIWVVTQLHLAIHKIKLSRLNLRVGEAEAARDITLAQQEARSKVLDGDLKQAMIPAVLRQVTSNIILPKEFAGIKTESFPVAIASKAQPEALPEPDPLPDRVDLADIWNPGHASIRKLVLGIGPQGRTIRGDIRELAHIAVAGTSRWGKSIFIQSLLYQIINAREKTDIRLSDIGGTSFVDFGLPYADDVQTTEEILKDLWAEAMRRKALYQATGQGIKSLEMYNAVTGQELPYVVFMADEVTVLMSHSKAMAKIIMDLIAYAAKYGIELILSGQNWKADNVNTTIRDQFSSRFQFKAMDKSQASILIPGTEAHEITTRGRAIAYIPEYGTAIPLQTPFIDADMIQATRDKPTILDLPIPPAAIDPIEQVVIETRKGGAGLKECYRVWHKLAKGEEPPKSIGGYQTQIIKDILSKHGVD